LTPENGGTMFDNTLIYMTSGISRGDHSGLDMPCLLAGSCGGYFKTGRTIDDGNQKNISRLLASIGNAMGLPVAKFGDPTNAHPALTGLTA